MKNKILMRSFIGLVLIIATTARAQELTQAEKEQALAYLESTRANLLATTNGLSEAQWNFKLAPVRWSVTQVMEHIAASEDFIRDGLVKEKVMVSVAGPPDRDVKKIDDAVVKMVPDRTHKGSLPPGRVQYAPDKQRAAEGVARADSRACCRRGNVRLIQSRLSNHLYISGQISPGLYTRLRVECPVPDEAPLLLSEADLTERVFRGNLADETR